MRTEQISFDKFDAVELLSEAASVGLPSEASVKDGWIWQAEMLKPGLSLNGNTYYTPEFIREAAADFQGCPCYADHQATPSGSIRNVVGAFRNVRSEETHHRDHREHRDSNFENSVPSAASAVNAFPVLQGELHLLKSENWIREKLLAAHEAEMPMGLSINAIVGLKRAVREGREVLEPQRIIPGTPRSVDLVMFPAAGGRVVRAIGSVDMESALAESRKRFQASGAGCGVSDLKTNTHLTPNTQHLTPTDTKGDQMEYTTENRSGTGVAQSLQPIREEITALKGQLEAAQHKQRIAEARLLVNNKLAESRLPEPLARLVREHFEGQAPTGEELDRQIASVREAYAAVLPGATGLSGRVAVTQEPQDRFQVALDKLFGLRQGPDGRDYDAAAPSFLGIQEAYIAMTGDRSLQWEPPAGRITEEWNSTGFANALGNTLYRRLIQDYREVDYGLDLLIPSREPHRIALKDFRTHEIVRVGDLGDLTAVDPEDDDWPEIAAPTDEKVTIAAVQFGGLITVTRKTIINDDIGLVGKIAARLGRAARRTMAQRVYNLLVNNAAIYDAVAFFHATHNNLGNSALSADALDAVRSAMRNQTEKDSGKRLGIGPSILVVPSELEGVAKITNTRQYVDSNFTPNKVQHMFGNNNERVVVTPLLTDANDWYVFANPDELQTFEIGFLQGKAEPELLLADNQVAGKAFTSDRIQYKVRHEYEVTAVDYRGAYKQVVT
ncbi:MAG: Mu-like prophage major head subunit gpT family protein [Acidobacteria bacterium]|nr:Mu-like prophage major head subunit gpT family protein [Acidobacteriota bacterium]